MAAGGGKTPKPKNVDCIHGKCKDGELPFAVFV